MEAMQKQPLNIREGDLVYQFHRLVVFARLLAAYPYKKEELFKECRADIPPLYRNLAWCALLNVPFNADDKYFRINKEVITSTGETLLILLSFFVYGCCRFKFIKWRSNFNLCEEVFVVNYDEIHSY